MGRILQNFMPKFYQPRPFIIPILSAVQPKHLELQHLCYNQNAANLTQKIAASNAIISTHWRLLVIFLAHFDQNLADIRFIDDHNNGNLQ